ncbi:MAG: apolipoprotein N-acyltransferase [Propionibacteriaceae bacterium]|nr:apolipoprotein N-acyltransferase [Propionibacteriaceae bacterium]
MARHGRHRWLLTGVCLVGGCAVGVGFPPLNLWWLVPVGIAIFAMIAVRSSPGAGLFRGFVFGLGFNTVAFQWVDVLGVPVLAAFVVMLALWQAVVGLVIAATRKTPAWGCLGIATWMGTEWACARWPFGGFGWGRLAYTSAGTPIDGWLPIISASGVSFLVVTSGFVLAWVIGPVISGAYGMRFSSWLRRVFHRRAPLVDACVQTSDVTPALVGEQTRRPGVGARITVSVRRVWETSGVRPWSVVVAVLLAAISGIGGLAFRSYDPAGDGGSVTVGVVQGNVPGTGIDAMGPIYTVENNHLAETIIMAAEIRTGQVQQPDFVLWPENSTTTDPYTDTNTAHIIGVAVDMVGVPIFVGAITLGPGDNERQTVGLWWTKDGVTTSYAKRNLVPFGEWIPYRSFFVRLVPQLEWVGAQSVPGTTPGVIDVEAGGQPLRVGDLICFEVSYDATVDQMLEGDQATGGGAQVVVVQTSNALFTGTDQMAQQDRITRIRAMEARREILVSTTNSLAGLIDSHGRVVYQAQLRTSDAQVFTVPTRTAITPAVAYRGWFDMAVIVLPILAGVIVLIGRRVGSWSVAQPVRPRDA